MKHTHYVRISLGTICFVMVFLFNGCSIFSPVGHAISQGYENTVTYFNVYYNAKWLFDEAEDEIQADIFSVRSKDSTSRATRAIPAGAKQKLGQVLDKCSYILEFHSSSTFVDDALLLIGKSFYYQAEYLKAERKFAELLAKYPDSPLALETQLWYARTEEKLGKLEEAIRLCEATVTTAQTDGDQEIEAQARQLLGLLYRKTLQVDKAVLEYEKEVALSSDEEIKSDAQINLGDIYYFDGQYDKAAEAYLQVETHTSDVYFNYYSKLQASIAFRKMGENGKALNIVDEMIDNFRFKEYLPMLHYERANIYAASEKLDDAINEYVYVDTTFLNTESATRSAYQLGSLYEKEISDYRLALKYYTKVKSASGYDIVADGQRKFTALTRYFDARKKLAMADSLFIILQDTIPKIISDTLSSNVSDSTLDVRTNIPLQSSQSKTDSLAAVKSSIDTTRHNNTNVVSQPVLTDADSLKGVSSLSDTTMLKSANIVSDTTLSKTDSLKVAQSILDTVKQKINIDTLSALSKADSLAAPKSLTDTTQVAGTQVASRPALPSADSLDVLKSIAAQELGDIFYSEIIFPDSAFYWYDKSLTWKYDSIRGPRILYILAELSRRNPEKNFPLSEENYTRLDQDFPESIYAEEARRFLGKASPLSKVDTAAQYYKDGEKQIDSKQYKKAIATFRKIVKSFPQSPLAAKSEYAIGWILENHLAQQDSALAQYKRIADKYVGTQYALAATKKTSNLAQSDTAKVDTASLKSAEIDTIKVGTAKIDTAMTGITKIDTVKIDSLRAAATKKDTAKTSQIKIDSIKIDTMQTKAAENDTTKTKAVKNDTTSIENEALYQKPPGPIETRRSKADSIRKIID